MKKDHHKQTLQATTVTVTVLHTPDLPVTTDPLHTITTAIEEHKDMILLENVAHPHEFEVELPDNEASKARQRNR